MKVFFCGANRRALIGGGGGGAGNNLIGSIMKSHVMRKVSLAETGSHYRRRSNPLTRVLFRQRSLKID